LGPDEVSGELWQLVTSIHDEGAGLMLVSDTHKVMATLIVMLSSGCCGGVFSSIS